MTREQRKALAGMIGNAILALMWAGMLFSRSPSWWALFPAAMMLWAGWGFEYQRKAFIGPEEP